MRRFETAHRIVELVAQMYELEPADIFNKDRHKTNATARLMCCLLIRHITPLSFPEIGRLMLRDHTTVLYGCGRMIRLMADDANEFEHHVYKTVRAMFPVGGPGVVKAFGAEDRAVGVAAE